ncbi:HemK2/MTQ2 family protein methyltransferase [Halovenus marina]|uniref:HemK2/MTQ2 family protein methyltransferase n=1 Tax=Halovenus marina TaxID=3396621 RepID=UPI003F56B61F
MTEEPPSLAERRDLEAVYQPAEDSALLSETACDRIDDEDRVLEVGVGSGFVAERVRERTGATVIGCDINREACLDARERGIETVWCDLTHPFAAESFDVVLCNPPYLPTPAEQEWSDPMEAALSGGPDGRAVVRRLLADVGRVLRSDGRLYLLVSSLTDPDAVREHAEVEGFTVSRVAQQKQPFERLVVLEITDMHS